MDWTDAENFYTMKGLHEKQYNVAGAGISLPFFSVIPDHNA